MNNHKLSKCEDLYEDLRLFDYYVQFVTRVKMTETRSDENWYETENHEYKENEWERENDSNSIDLKEDVNSSIYRESKEEKRFRRREDLASNHRWRNEREVKKRTLTNEAIRQREYESSADRDETRSTAKMLRLQQSQMIIKRMKRTKMMNLTEKRNMKSKIFNFIMSILEEWNTNKKSAEKKSYRFRKFTAFSIERRSQRRELSIEDQTVIEKWFNVFDIIIESMIKTSKQRKKIKRLFYTWRNCFVMKMIDIKIIDLMKHSIIFKSKFKSVKKKISKYTLKKREFANQIFSQMKEIDIITRMNSDWEARTKFSSKKKKSDQLRMVHNYISLNNCTIKMQYSVHKIKEMIDILMKLKFKAFFFTNAIWEYWAVIIKKKDVYKTEFVSSHEQWAYLRISMKLTKSSHTYAQFTNLIFESLSSIKEFLAQKTIIEDHEKVIFASFVNDHSDAKMTFEALFDFLHEHYFSEAAFELIYLNSRKIIAFIEKLNMIEFIDESNEFRSFVKHCIKIMKWLILINRAKLNDFLWLTSFLRQFISERVDHVLIMKEAYMIQISAKSTRVKSKTKVKKCDEDLTKVLRKRKVNNKAITTIRRQWMKRFNEKFVWDSSQQTSFDHVKRSITKNAMTVAMHELQYHLAADANRRVTDACLFQLLEKSFDTIMTSQLKNKFKIMMFMSFRLSDAETRYSNTEKECLAIVNVLTETRWLIVDNKWKIICYTNHHALNSIMTKESNEYDRIAIWQDKLREYDIKVIHRFVTNSMIDIIDELSRLSIELTTKYRIVNQERSHFMTRNDEDENDDNDSMKEMTSKRVNNMTDAIMSKEWTKSTRRKHLSAEHEIEEWKKYDWNSLFKSMMTYLRFELKKIKKLSRQKRKVVISQSFKYSLTSKKSLLMYHEQDERKSSCLTKDQIKSILKHLHDDHNHYNHVITFDRMKKEAYWSTRTQDVITWCKSCFVCQLNANKHSTAAIRHVLTFELMSMIKLNFLNFIRSTCSITRCRYILLEVNYFSRFVWARSYVYCTMTKSTNLMNNHIASVFEWLKVIYSNNDKHFVEYEFEKLLKEREVMHFTTSMSHSSSIELKERLMQLMIEDIRKKCIQRETSKTWAFDVIDETITINIRKIRIHEHRLCDIMLRFVLKIIHHDTTSNESSIWENEMKNFSEHAQNVMMILKAKNRILALEIMTRYQNEKESKQQKHKNKITKEDLVLIRDKVRDNQKKRKLNVKWKELRMMIMKIKHDLSIWIKSLYEVEKSTRYHVNNLRSWIKRKTNDEWSTAQLINELISQDHDVDENDEKQLIIIIQTIDEIDSFRISLTIEVQREAMIFANYSDQRTLLLWKSRSFWKCRFHRVKILPYKLSRRRVCFSFIHTRSKNYSSLKQSIILIKSSLILSFSFDLLSFLHSSRNWWQRNISEKLFSIFFSSIVASSLLSLSFIRNEHDQISWKNSKVQKEAISRWRTSARE